MFSKFDDFVNRDAEIKLFTELLHEPFGILILHGVEGIGKTRVIHRLRQVCSAPNVKAVLVDFRDKAQLAEPEYVIRRLRERVGGTFAERLGQVETRFQQEILGSTFSSLAASSSQTVAGRVNLYHSREIHVGGDIVGGAKISVTINLGGALSMNAREIETRRNTALRDALKEVLAERSMVLFFDHFEDATTPVGEWLCQHILRLHLEEIGEYPNLWIVVAGRTVPLQEEVEHLSPVIRYLQVEPLSEEAITLFWVHLHRLDPDKLVEVIQASQGNPQRLVAEAYKAVQAAIREKTDE